MRSASRRVTGGPIERGRFPKTCEKGDRTDLTSGKPVHDDTPLDSVIEKMNAFTENVN